MARLLKYAKYMHSYVLLLNARKFTKKKKKKRKKNQKEYILKTDEENKSKKLYVSKI